MTCPAGSEVDGFVNPRERFLQVALFGKPDRIPLSIGGVRPLTRQAWIKQGLPPDRDVVDYLGFGECTIGSRGIASYPSEGFEWKPGASTINLGPLPPFKPRMVRQDERHRVWVDGLGITQMGFQHDWKNGWSGFATRVFMEFPVKDMGDFLKIKRRYNPKDPSRYPSNWREMARRYRDRDYPLSVGIRGPFWWTRDMMGLKAIAVGMHRRPELVKEAMHLCAEFQMKTLHRALDDVELDYVVMSEDMGYRDGSMIGPSTMREFMGPAYSEIAQTFRDHGVKLIMVDSDGNVEALIPVWLEYGINGLTPCEVAANMDVVRLGRKFPELVMMGGLSKRSLVKGKDAIEEEVTYKVPPLARRRGYFPGVDHAVPPDITMDNYKYFVELLRKLCGW